MAHFSINAQSTAWLKRLAIFLGVFAFMVLSACGGGFSVVTSPDTLPPSLVTSPNTPSPSVDVSPNPLTPGVSQAALSIKVENLDGSAIAAVNILSSTGVAAATDAQGQAQINLSIGQDITLALTKTGVANQVKVLRIPAGSASVQLRVTMLAREAAQTLADIGAGGMVQGKDGALASFPAGSLVDANGNVVTGAVQMQLTPVNVLADAAAFPGVFAGTQGAAAPMGIVSYGTAEFHPTQGGQKLQVAPGKTVTIEIPMYATKNPNGSAVLLGQVIPLWSLNEATGIWKQEGTGTVVANAGSPTVMADHTPAIRNPF